MNNQNPQRDSLSYAQRQYDTLIQSYIAVKKHATRVYLNAWEEFWTSPQTLMKRNMSFFQEVITPPKPAWQTPHRVMPIARGYDLLIKLLDFSQPDISGEGLVPTLLLPPQAGHHSYIADYSHDQSQVQTLRQAGMGNIYCIEWLSATEITRNTGIEEYIEVIRYCIEQIGGKANLVGDCQGGWLATIFAAMYPDMVNTLSVAGAPIDFQAGNGPILQTVNFVAENFPDKGMDFYRSLVLAGNGLLQGSFLISGFNLMRPQQLPERFLTLYEQMLDEPAVTRFRQMKDWYDYPQNVSGKFYLWLVEHLFRDNKLIKGTLEVGGRTVSMRDITCPIFLLAGKRDHITPPPQVFEMENYVGTPPAQIEKYLVQAGHIGLFMGREILRDTWSEIGAHMYQYSIIEEIADADDDVRQSA